MKYTADEERHIEKLMAENNMTREEVEAYIERGMKLMMKWLEERVTNLIEHHRGQFLGSGGIVSREPAAIERVDRSEVVLGEVYLPRGED